MRRTEDETVCQTVNDQVCTTVTEQSCTTAQEQVIGLHAMSPSKSPFTSLTRILKCKMAGQTDGQT